MSGKNIELLETLKRADQAYQMNQPPSAEAQSRIAGDRREWALRQTDTLVKRLSEEANKFVTDAFDKWDLKNYLEIIYAYFDNGSALQRVGIFVPPRVIGNDIFEIGPDGKVGEIKQFSDASAPSPDNLVSGILSLARRFKSNGGLAACVSVTDNTDRGEDESITECRKIGFYVPFLNDRLFIFGPPQEPLENKQPLHIDPFPHDFEGQIRGCSTHTEPDGFRQEMAVKLAYMVSRGLDRFRMRG